MVCLLLLLDRPSLHVQPLSFPTRRSSDLYTRHAEFTISTTKPLPSHRPWSGGSNLAPKFVISLSRLLTPLKLATTPPSCVPPPCCESTVGARRAEAPACATGACR